MLRIFTLVLAGITLISVVFFCFHWSAPVRQMTYGVSFSSQYAQYLDLDWQKTYEAMLSDLGVKHLRLMAYWDDIEPARGVFDFSKTDWQIAEAKKHDAEVILSIGFKLPRWPECQIPPWATALPEPEFRERVSMMLQKVVEHYKDEPTITAWQVENEPFAYWRGGCTIRPTKDSMDREVHLVRSLDNRPIVITDSGEFSSWNTAARLGDRFGSTFYRLAWNHKGYLNYDYFFPPSFYAMKLYLNHLDSEHSFVSELQAEPWTPDGILQTSLSDQARTMNVDQLHHNVVVAERAGFSTVYFWGVEWWYWMKEKQSDSHIWEAALPYFVQMR